VISDATRQRPWQKVPKPSEDTEIEWCQEATSTHATPCTASRAPPASTGLQMNSPTIAIVKQARSVSEHMKRFIGASQKWICAHCHELLDHCYQTDHVIPLAEGGSNEASNLQALCPGCHARKTIEDLHAERSKYGYNPSRARKPRVQAPAALTQPLIPAPPRAPARSPYFTPGTPQHEATKMFDQFRYMGLGKRG